MNTTTKPGVDVRAVLDRVACLAAGSFTIEDVREARATVELMADALEACGMEINGIRNRKLTAGEQRALDLSRAALAAFRGDV